MKYPLLLCAALAACSDSDSQASEAPIDANGPVKVLAVNYPLRYFAERIGGDHVTATLPAPADVDPAYWTPDPDVVRRYQKAELILLNGADYAKWIAKVSLPTSRMVNTSKAAAERYIALEEAVVHTHGPGGEHEHTGHAFTTWLDPTIAIEQAHAVAKALTAARPQHASVFGENLQALEQDLQELDRSFAAAVAQDPRRLLLGSHPVYQYLVRKYSLEMRSVHWEPDEAPSQAMWQEFEALRKEHPAAWMLWEGAPLLRVADQLEEKGVQSVVFDPCGNNPEGGDFMSVMRENAEALQQAFAK